MLIGYARISKADGSQSTDLQRDALLAAGVDPANIFEDHASGAKDDQPELFACLRALRPADVLCVYKLDRLGRSMSHLMSTIEDLDRRGIAFRVLTGAEIDTTTAGGRLIFNIFASLSEWERSLIRERTVAGLASARARGRVGGRPTKMTAAKVRLAAASMGKPGTVVGDLCVELGVSRQTLYRHVGPTGELRTEGEKILAGK